MRFRQHMWMGEYFLRKDDTLWKIDGVQDGKVDGHNKDVTCIIPESEVEEVFGSDRYWREGNRIENAKAVIAARKEARRLCDAYESMEKATYAAHFKKHPMGPDDELGKPKITPLPDDEKGKLALAWNDMLLAVERQRNIAIENGGYL